METKTKSSKRKIKCPGFCEQLDDDYSEESFIKSLKEETTADIETPYDDSFIDCVDYISKEAGIRLKEGYELIEMGNDSNFECKRDNDFRGILGLNSYTKQDDGTIHSVNYTEKKEYKMMLGEKINKSKLNSFENLAHLSLKNLI